MCRFTLLLPGILVLFVCSTSVYAEVYLLDDFESYKVGDPLDSGDLWIIHQASNTPGEASDKSDGLKTISVVGISG